MVAKRAANYELAETVHTICVDYIADAAGEPRVPARILEREVENLIRLTGTTRAAIAKARGSARAASVDGLGLAVAADIMAARLLGPGYSARTVRRARQVLREQRLEVLETTEAKRRGEYVLAHGSDAGYVPEWAPASELKGADGKRVLPLSAHEAGLLRRGREETRPISLRLRKSLMDRIDKHAGRITAATPGLRIDRTRTIESLIVQALDANESAAKRKGKR